MRVEVEAGAPESVETDVLAAPQLAAEPLSSRLAAFDGRLGDLLSRLVEDGEAAGKLKTAPLVHLDGELKAERLAVAGVGARDALDADALRTAAGTVARESREFAESIAWLLDDSFALPLAEQARAIVDGTLLGSYDPGHWKSAGDAIRLERLIVVTDDEAAAEAAGRAGVVAGWANRARDLANAPPNDLTPAGLAESAAGIADGSEILGFDVLDLDQIRDLGMGAFAGVAQGSHNPARLIVLRYEPPRPVGDVVLGLVGKAVTFDTGGISIKKPTYMEDMKGDMAGGGAVIAALGSLAELEIPLRTVGVVGATENDLADGARRLVAQDDQPRGVVAALRDAGERAHAEVANLVEVQDVEAEDLRAVGDPGRTLGQPCRSQVVRRRVGEVTRAIRPPGDDSGAAGRLGGRFVGGDDDKALERRGVAGALPAAGVVGAEQRPVDDRARLLGRRQRQ